MQIKSNFYITTLVLLLGLIAFGNPSTAAADITFTSATNGQATLVDTIDDDGVKVFVFGGLASGETTGLSFATDSDCPMVAMTGGAEFASHWNCAAGAISVSVAYKGGLSFGPDGNPETFYLTFSNPPTPPGMDSPPSAFAGIQIAVYGDVSQWSLSGEMSVSGAAFGVELSGPQGGEAHFRMYLPADAVEFLGGVIGVNVGGKLDPFATVTMNDDGSADLTVDIENLQGSGFDVPRLFASGQKTITKKITASERKLGIAGSKSSVKAGSSVTLAMCAGKEFTAGDEVPLKFTLNKTASGSFKAAKLTLDSRGCATKKVKIPKGSSGTLTSQVSYKGSKAKANIKITK